jgi:hypothetical protein
MVDFLKEVEDQKSSSQVSIDMSTLKDAYINMVSEGTNQDLFD